MTKYHECVEAYDPYKNISPEVADAADDLLRLVGVNTLDSQHTKMTPYRLAHYLQHWTRPKADLRFTVFDNVDPKIDQMVCVNPIPFWACCSHHMLPFFGTVYFGYIPNEKLVGLSMVPLLIKEFCARPWLQEILTSEIANLFEEKLDPVGLGVCTVAMHTCQMLDLQGPPVPQMMFSEMRGTMRDDPSARVEFMRLTNIGD